MRKRLGSQGVGMGVGYVSVMLIFAVICLTIFAVLSFKAASSGDKFNERSGEFLKQYYAADTKAKETLSKLNDCAFNASTGMFFEEEFEEYASGVEGVSLKQTADGFSASYSVVINDRQELAVSVLFNNSGRYTIEQWQSLTIYEEESGSHLGVWDGRF